MKRISLFALPVACLAVMASLVACGGSNNGSSTPKPPTLEETVNAVKNAQTPAQGTYAFNSVQTYVGVTSTAEYNAIPADQRAELAEMFGEAIAAENINPGTGTYADGVTAANEVFGTTADTQDVLDQLNADLGAAAGDPSVPARKQLQLLLEIEGGGAAPAKHMTPVGSLLFAQWFAARVVPDATPLVRSACTNGCAATYVSSSRLLNLVIRAELVALRFSVLSGLITPAEYARAVVILNAAAALGHQAIVARYTTCLAGCHGQ